MAESVIGLYKTEVIRRRTPAGSLFVPSRSPLSDGSEVQFPPYVKAGASQSLREAGPIQCASNTALDSSVLLHQVSKSVPSSICPQKPARQWLNLADTRYIAARYLCWKGLQVEFILAMHHSLELLFKTYLNLAQGRFPRTHALTALCEACGTYDARFLAYVEDPNWSLGYVEGWLDFWRYPENAQNQRCSVWGTDDLFRLDSIARLVHLAVDPNNEEETEIRRLMLGQPTTAVQLGGHHDPQIKALFLHRNSFFDQDGWPVRALPQGAWRPCSPPASRQPAKTTR